VAAFSARKSNNKRAKIQRVERCSIGMETIRTRVDRNNSIPTYFPANALCKEKANQAILTKKLFLLSW
jgi:hypothetical protein